MQKTTQTETAWKRLSVISESRALELWRAGQYGIGQYCRKTGNRTSFSAPEEIKENVEILGRNEESELKARVMWYMTYHPKSWAAAIDATSAA